MRLEADGVAHARRRGDQLGQGQQHEQIGFGVQHAVSGVVPRGRQRCGILIPSGDRDVNGLGEHAIARRQRRRGLQGTLERLSRLDRPRPLERQPGTPQEQPGARPLTALTSADRILDDRVRDVEVADVHRDDRRDDGGKLGDRCRGRGRRVHLGRADEVGDRRLGAVGRQRGTQATIEQIHRDAEGRRQRLRTECAPPAPWPHRSRQRRWSRERVSRHPPERASGTPPRSCASCRAMTRSRPRYRPRDHRRSDPRRTGMSSRMRLAASASPDAQAACARRPAICVGSTPHSRAPP